MQQTHWVHSFIGILTAGLLALGVLAGPGAAHAAKPTKKPHLDFDMVVSGGAATCLPDAQGEVHVVSLGPVEVMNVAVKGLPPNTDFDFFVIQLPVAPFGLSWYQGDIETDDSGHGHQIFIGRFSIETFIVQTASKSSLHQCGNKLTVFLHLIRPDSNRMGIEK